MKLRTEQGRDNEHLLLRLLDSRAKGLEAVVGFSVQGGVSQPMSDVRYLKVPSVFEALVVSREITFIQKP